MNREFPSASYDAWKMRSPDDDMPSLIELICRGCGRVTTYERGVDPDLPRNVTRIESNLCDECDDGGGFGEEQWFDAEGREVIPS